jgi:uncharacterized membrane protein (DUF4010 family)
MNDIALPIQLKFFIALGLSFLIGLERESSGFATKGRVFAGVRTYSLIGVYGFSCGWLVSINLPYALPVGMISLTALAIVGYLAKLKHDFVGWTSEVAALLTFVMGAMCLLTDIWVPLALGIVGTFLLSEKAMIEKYVESLNNAEFLAVVKFLLITLIILPVLPNKEYTEFNLNPQKIWRIVVLVSTVGFAGYFLVKKFGDKAGLWLSGLLGGIVSSTAVSIAAGRIAQHSPDRSVNALQSTILASTVMYIRILALIWFIKPDFVAHIWLKLVLLALIGLLLSIHKETKAPVSDIRPVQTVKNPFEIKPALIFASLFVILSVVTVLAKNIYGNAGLLTLSGIVGVTDIDPFILSVVNQGSLIQTLAISAIIISMMSNTIVKGVYFGFLAKTVRKSTAWRFGLWALLHIPILFIPY